MLPLHGVTVLWDWEWTHDQDGDGDISGEGDPESQEQNNPYLHSDVESDRDSQSEDEFSIPTQTHTVKFSSTHDINGQEVLFNSSKLRDDVQTKLQPQPTPQYDSRAIAFLCYIDDKWQKVSYVVKECVHAALTER